MSMSITTPPVEHPHTVLIGFLEPWQPSGRPATQSWIDWGASFFQPAAQPAVVHQHHNYSLLSMGPSLSIGSNNVTNVVNNDNRSNRKDKEVEGREKSNIPPWVLPLAVI